MTYETVATYCQVISLLMFIAMFAAVVLYAMWPGRAAEFDELQRRALNLDRNQPNRRGQ
jgi:cytochrome c oxidase cbb3-type subunit 4